MPTDSHALRQTADDLESMAGQLEVLIPATRRAADASDGNAGDAGSFDRIERARLRIFTAVTDPFKPLVRS